MEGYKMINSSKTKVIVVFLLYSCVVVAIAQQEAGPQGKTETKVSESHKGGKYIRITETFTDKVLTSRREEVSMRDDGRINFVFEKYFRDGQMIYASSLEKDKNRTVRSYHYKEKLVVMEGDEDGDKFFETMILFNEDEEPVEAFERKKDGTVMPFSKEKLEALKKSFSKLQGVTVDQQKR
jgi:hypothetical protein